MDFDSVSHKIWPGAFHSHFVKTNLESELSFIKYSSDDFVHYATWAYQKAQHLGLAFWGITDYNFDPVRWASSLYPNLDLFECTRLWEKVGLRYIFEDLKS
jgi:hypothetical protein